MNEIIKKHKTSGLSAGEIQDLRRLLGESCTAYYTTDRKVMSDEEYDALNDVYRHYTGEIVSGSKGTTTAAHEYANLMCTLEKVSSVDELKDWITSTAQGEEVSLLVSDKLDGNSIMIEYGTDGKVVSAVTRGKDGKGMDIYRIFKGDQLPFELASPTAIKYEALVSKSIMDELSEARGKELADPRGAITGLLHKDEGASFRRFIDLAAIDIQVRHGHMTRALVVETVKKIPSNAHCRFLAIRGKIVDVVTRIREIYDRQAAERAGWDYMVDGMVVEHADEPTRNYLGWHRGSSTYPKFAVALKYPYMERATRAVRMEFDVGSSGRVTPCVVFEPVKINGRTYSRTSIANYKRFCELKIGPGTHLLFALRHDVLGYLDVVDCEENKEIAPFEHIDNCPHCGGQLSINENETFVYCEGEGCGALTVGALLSWCRKLSLKGIADSTLWKLVEAGLAKEPKDLYRLDVAKAAALPGLGRSSVAALVATLATRLSIKDYEVLAAVSPEGIGRTICKPVCKRYRFSELVTKARAGTAVPLLLEVEGVSGINAKKIAEGLKDSVVEWALSGVDVTVEETYMEPRPAPEGEVMGSETVSFCVTGKINNFANREELVAAAEARGHQFTSSMTAKTNVLVNNDTTSASSKNKKAKQLGKPIMSEDEFCRRYLGMET